MQRAIATTTLPGNPGEKLRATAAAGFGLAITALQPFCDFEALPEPRRNTAFERAARKFELLHPLGTDTLLICSNVSKHAIDDPARAAARWIPCRRSRRTRSPWCSSPTRRMPRWTR